MWAEIEALSPWAEMDVAVFTGIQIHTPHDDDHIQALTSTLRTAAADTVELDLSI
jgi:hypothetical protein